MTRRTEQINELFKNELANLISKNVEFNNGLITVTYVDCSPDLKNAKIGISVLPDNMFGTALKKLKPHNSFFAKELKRKLNIRCIPKFNWVVDDREKHAAKIEDVLNQIKNE